MAKELMHWTKQKRWQKRYSGKLYGVSPRQLGTPATKEASRAAANKWWEKKKAEIDAAEEAKRNMPPELIVQIIRKDYAKAIEDIDGVLRTHQLFEPAESDTVQRLQSRRDELEALMHTDSPPPLDFAQRHPGFVFSRYAESDQPEPAEKTIGAWVGKWLARKRALVNGGEIAPDRYSSYKYAIEYFRDWMGEGKLVQSINAQLMEDFHSHLLEEVGKRDKDKAQKAGMARRYAKGRLDTAKQFVKWLYGKDVIELPKNLVDPRALKISVPTTRNEPTPLTTVRRLLKDTKISDRIRLWILLMLNCGMYQGDIAKLRHDQVDWKRGRISRKRSKTENHTNVPEVNYKLWNMTFTLLKKHRSKHPELVLVNKDGGPLQTKYVGEDDKGKKVCNITSAYKRARKKVEYAEPLSRLRKTSANLLYNHKEFKPLHTLFLGHSPQTVAERFYVEPEDDTLDDAIDWLAEQYKLG